MEAKKYTIEDLAELTGYTRRTIRYYVQEGLLEPPAGRGRGGFYYDSHLKMLLQIKAFQEKGMGITAIASMLRDVPYEGVQPSREVVVRYEIVPGIELSVGRDVEIRESKKILEIIRIARAIAQGKVKNESSK